MGAEQAIYISMGLLSMTSLAGLGVAVGSGVVMMMEAEVRPATAPLPCLHSEIRAKTNTTRL